MIALSTISITVMLTVSDANASGITVSGGTPARSSGI
jgi:hypothetical protein